jgi:hypothetical protein
MINIADINSQDILNVRDYGKCTVISVDHNGNKNPFKRTAILVKTKNNKQVWIAPERVINKENEHDSNSSNVINGEASLWSAKFNNLGENKKSMKKIQLTESDLKKLIREQTKKILKEGKDPFSTLDIVRSILFDISTKRTREPEQIKKEIQRSIRILTEYLNTISSK